MIATGFEHKDPFTKKQAPKAEPKKEDKIVMTLGAEPARPKAEVKKPIADPLAPTLVDEIPMPQIEDAQIDLPFMTNEVEEEVEEESAAPVHLQLKLKDEDSELEKEKKELEAKKQQLSDKFEQLRQNILGNTAPKSNTNNSFPTSAASGGYLARPSNIYAESKGEVSTSKPAEEPVPAPLQKLKMKKPSTCNW